MGQWQYHFLKMASRLVCLLPYTWVLAIGAQVGKLYYRIAKKQRERALRQIQERMDLSPQAAQAIIASLCAKLGQTVMEVLYIPALTPEFIAKHITIENRHYLDEALAEGHGVVFLTGHMGNWEWLGAVMSIIGFPMTSVIRRQENDQVTRFLNENRQWSGIEIFAKGTNEMLGAMRALKQKKILGLVADQDAGVDGQFVEFFACPASTPSGPAVFARRFKAPVVSVFIVRKPGGGHRVLVQPPLYFVEQDGEEADLLRLTQEMTTLTEQVIREFPDEWLWFQKRWATRPASTQEEKNEKS
ncbi:lysophospholipid acyltransferase family protein [Azotosporobacter soli]|uniref:lysophospholipid acyltransferase family protein n=1 Tax=Azotosporobacter soli TaxID=3055040 RepID=UPI0031FEBB17